MLKDLKRIVPTLPVSDLNRSAKFYSETLGLQEVSRNQDDGGINYGLPAGPTLHIHPKPGVTATDNTMVAFTVDDFDGTTDSLRSKGVQFEKFEDMPGVTWDGDIAVAGDEKAVWVKDPDGHLLAISNSPTV